MMISQEVAELTHEAGFVMFLRAALDAEFFFGVGIVELQTLFAGESLGENFCRRQEKCSCCGYASTHEKLPPGKS